jgi:hypothetical protein
MKKIIFALIVTICSLNISVAQNYKKIFYKSQTIENNDIKITIENAVATPAGVKFRLTIYNKTNDYIIYKPSESIFKLGGKEGKPVEKWLIIRPNHDDYITVNLKGSDYMVASNYDFVMDGIYKVSVNAPGLTTADFKLPPSQNDFKTGGFNITVDKIKKETARTDAKFKVNYTGDKVGIFEPNKVAMKMPDGKEYANYHSDKEPLIFAKGDNDDFVVAWKDIPTASGDMQKVDMIILWRDAFKEIIPEKIAKQTLTVMFDQEMTDAKGKGK